MTVARHSASEAPRSRREARLRRRRSALLGLVSVVLLVAASALTPLLAAGDASASLVTPTAVTSAVSKTVTEARTHLDATTGAEVEVDRRTVSITVGQTTSLRDRQAVDVSWTGAHPSGGYWPDSTSIQAAQTEYPVVVMQCRGKDDSSLPLAQQIRPETCWTQSADERTQIDTTNFFAPFRMDRYASVDGRQVQVGVPTPFPDACKGNESGAQHWVPFVASDGTNYPGGPTGCAGMAPEAVNASSSLTPSNTTYGATFNDGTGSTKFVMNTAETNASLGCSATVPCSLVVIPIIGVSCDVAGSLMPASLKTPTRLFTRIAGECETKGNFLPGSVTDGSIGTNRVAVSGQLWWTPSNWQNRVVFPLSFAVSSNVCDIVSTGKPLYLYGSQVMQQATQQWAPEFCLDTKKFRFQHVQFSEPGSRSLLVNGSVEAALSAGPPSAAYESPVVQAPIGISGFAIVFRLDRHDGREATDVKLTPRLLAKLLTMSYPATTNIRSDYKALADNPLDLLSDPEFRALNPDMMVAQDGYNPIASSTLFSLSSDSDVVAALTGYINADPEARAWLDGAPDPWGMRVNPGYKAVALPVDSWPVLDTFQSVSTQERNPCLAANPVPTLPLIAAPVSNPAQVTLNLQFQVAASQFDCKDPGAPNQKLVALGRQRPGIRALFGVVSLADARRYQIPQAALQTQVTADAPSQFTDATGRTFVAPTDASLRAAIGLLKADKALGTWTFPYDQVTKPAGAAAYPGTLLLSLSVPTKGLPAADAVRYAQFINYAVTTGQTPGPNNGQLPDGYLPMTAANGAGALVSFSTAAAAAVKAQQGYVPAVDGSTRPPSPSPTPLPSTGSPLPPGGSGGGTLDTGGTTDSGTTSSSAPEPTAAPAPTPTPSSSPVGAVPVAYTAAIGTGAATRALPALLALAVGCGVAAAVTLLWRRG